MKISKVSLDIWKALGCGGSGAVLMPPRDGPGGTRAGNMEARPASRPEAGLSPSQGCKPLVSRDTQRLGDFLPPLLQGDVSPGRTPLRGSILSTVSLTWFSLKRLGWGCNELFRASSL